MNTKNLLFLVLSFILVSSVSAKKKPPKNFYKDEFSKKEILKDIQYIRSALHIHPALYDYISEQELNKKFASAEQQVKDGMSKREVYNLLAPVISSIKDGHTSLTIPNDYVSVHKKKGGTFFPYRVHFKNGKTYTVNACEPIPQGSEILSVNNIPAERICANLTDNCSALLDAYKYSRIGASYPKLLFNTYNFKDKFEVEYVDINTGKKSVANINGTSLTYSKSKRFDFKEIEKGVGYLEVNSLYLRGWSDLAEMDLKIDTLFNTINSKGIEHLIIDIRNNGGGSDMMVKQFIKHLTDKPYALVRKQISFHLSREGRKFMRKERRSVANTLFFPLFPFFSWERKLYFSRKEISEMLSFEDKKPEPVADSLMFKGKLYAIYNTNTFSSANEMANVLSSYDIAETYGTETGCPVVQSGELKYVYTKNTLLCLSVSQKKFWYPGSDDVVDAKTNHGVIPQHIIADDPYNFKNEKDCVIQSVLDDIKLNYAQVK